MTPRLSDFRLPMGFLGAVNYEQCQPVCFRQPKSLFPPSMWPETSATLLTSLNDPHDREAWDQFTQLYRPAIYRFSRRMGLQDADADDATQKVLQSVARSIESKPPDLQLGKFRSWLAQVTRNAVLNLVARRKQDTGSGLSSVMRFLDGIAAAEPDITAAWQHEERLTMFRTAAESVKSNCTVAVWKSFQLTAVEGRSCEQVAKHLGISVGVVYASRSRILKRIRKVIEERSENGSEPRQATSIVPVEGASS